jgi:hypothetical protein
VRYLLVVRRISITSPVNNRLSRGYRKVIWIVRLAGFHAIQCDKHSSRPGRDHCRQLRTLKLIC